MEMLFRSPRTTLPCITVTCRGCTRHQRHYRQHQSACISTPSMSMGMSALETFGKAHPIKDINVSCHHSAGSNVNICGQGRKAWSHRHDPLLPAILVMPLVLVWIELGSRGNPAIVFRWLTSCCCGGAEEPIARSGRSS